MDATRRFSLEHPVVPGDPPEAAACVAAASGLSKGAVKDAMAKGAVWVARAGGPPRRLRRVKAAVRPGDVVTIHYDAELLAWRPPEPRLLRDATRWSAWWKPAGLLSQGSPFGDHGSLLRFAEVSLDRAAFLVHRLDRETDGVMLVVHDGKAAAAFSALFREGRIEKRYLSEVKGDVAASLGAEGTFDAPLDGKQAVTRYRVVSYDPDRDATLLDLTIETGRTHQIRRHLEAAGHPVLGDPRYGAGASDPRGLRLTAVSLAFRDPFTGEEVSLSQPSTPTRAPIEAS